jgi:hypothetical protein
MFNPLAIVQYHWGLNLCTSQAASADDTYIRNTITVAKALKRELELREYFCFEHELMLVLGSNELHGNIAGKTEKFKDKGAPEGVRAAKG